MSFIVIVTFGFYFQFSVECTPVVNGNHKPLEPDVGAYPYHANVMQKLSYNNAYHSFCGGSLIHPQWVLTAAHCIQLDSSRPAIKASDVFVGLGSIYRDSRGGQIIGAKKLIIHPNYLKTDRDDIGLIRLINSAKLGKTVNVIALHRNNKENLVGKTVYLTGFGVINDYNTVPLRLRKAVLHIGNYSKCYSDEEYSSVELCATSTVSEGKACRGDSGGPLVLLRGGKYYQVGITSHLAVLPLCNLGFNHSVYTRVSAYIAWIAKVTGIRFVKAART